VNGILSEMPPDRFDQVRRASITRRTGVFPIQQRPAEILNRRIRDPHRKLTGARPSSYNDNVIKRLALAASTDPEGQDHPDEHDALVNPLVYKNYPWIDCTPCTAKVDAGAVPHHELVDLGENSTTQMVRLRTDT
jgi:3'-phosphoadenosine 5'-phosphosulfate sulfotransferase (PAPS reductase)/FAD synthetase